jgi:hypothetical protein
MKSREPKSVTDISGRLRNALREETHRKNVNDSKFRAVAQRMDYEGFRQMVLGADLKSVKAGEVYTISNSVVDRNKNPLYKETSDKATLRSDPYNSHYRISRNFRTKTGQEKWAEISCLEIEQFRDWARELTDFDIFAQLVSLFFDVFVKKEIEAETERGLQLLRELVEKPDIEKACKMLSRQEKLQFEELKNLVHG